MWCCVGFHVSASDLTETLIWWYWGSGGRKSKLIFAISVYFCGKELLVSPGWKGPHVANLTLGLEEWSCHIGDSVLLSITGRLGIQQQQELNQPWSVETHATEPMLCLHCFHNGHSIHSPIVPAPGGQWQGGRMEDVSWAIYSVFCIV